MDKDSAFGVVVIPLNVNVGNTANPEFVAVMSDQHPGVVRSGGLVASTYVTLSDRNWYVQLLPVSGTATTSSGRKRHTALFRDVVSHCRGDNCDCVMVHVSLSYSVNPLTPRPIAYFVTLEASLPSNLQFAWASVWAAGEEEPLWPAHTSFAEFVGLRPPNPDVADDATTMDYLGPAVGALLHAESVSSGLTGTYLGDVYDRGSWKGNPSRGIPQQPLAIMVTTDPPTESARALRKRFDGTRHFWMGDDGVTVYGSRELVCFFTELLRVARPPKYTTDALVDWSHHVETSWAHVALARWYQELHEPPTGLAPRPPELLSRSMKAKAYEGIAEELTELMAILDLAACERVALESSRRRHTPAMSFWDRAQAATSAGQTPQGVTDAQLAEARSLVREITEFRFQVAWEQPPETREFDAGHASQWPSTRHFNFLRDSLLEWSRRRTPYDVACAAEEALASWNSVVSTQIDAVRAADEKSRTLFLRLGATVVAVAGLVGVATGLAAIPSQGSFFQPMAAAGAWTLLGAVTLAALTFLGWAALEHEPRNEDRLLVWFITVGTLLGSLALAYLALRNAEDAVPLVLGSTACLILAILGGLWLIPTRKQGRSGSPW